VGHDEESLSEMRGSDFRRREYSRFNSVTHSPKVFAYIAESDVEVVWHILEEAKSWTHLSDNPGDVWPEMPRIVGSAAFSCNRERLARVPPRDAIHDSTPRAAIEGLDIVPTRSLIQGLVFHPRHESGRRVSFPFDIAHGSGSGLGKFDSEFKSPDSGAEGQNVEGT
jgi:hypothetical protein